MMLPSGDQRGAKSVPSWKVSRVCVSRSRSRIQTSPLPSSHRVTAAWDRSGRIDSPDPYSPATPETCVSAPERSIHWIVRFTSTVREAPPGR